MRKILKKIFPIILLKRGFLLYNQIKTLTLDAILFDEYVPNQNELIHHYSENPFIRVGIDVHTFTANVQEGFLRWLNPSWTQDQYIVKIQSKEIYIEGKSGWGVINGRKLIYYSLGFARAPHVHKPTIKEFVFKVRNEVYLPKVISLRDTGEENYFHFYNDVIPKLFLLEDYHLLNEDYHLVVSHKLWDKPYFQFFIEAANLKSLKWFVQRQEWIKSNEVIFCKPLTHSKNYLIRMSNIMLKNVLEMTPRRVFLTRKKESLRYLENEDEVYGLLSQYGFEKIDTAKLTIEEQISIFYSATDIIALHGAGITNIIFRKGKPLRILEIFHDNEYLPFHYPMLSALFNFTYSAIRGYRGRQANAGGFKVDMNEISSFCEINYSKN